MRLVIITSILSSIIFASSVGASEILLLNSYHPGMAWTDSITNEVRKDLLIWMPSASLTVEYMDSDRQDPNSARFAELRDLYRDEYGNESFDLILASDDDAFQFLLEYRDEIFPGVPVVFCGVNYFSDVSASNQRVTRRSICILNS